MRSPSPTLIGLVVAPLLFLSACSPDSIAPPATERTTSAGGILTSFDRLTLARGGDASFRAGLLLSSARLSSAGLDFVSRTPSVARVTAVNGRAQVQGLVAGRTWVVVQSAAFSD